MLRKDIQTRQLADGTQLSIPLFHFPGTHTSAASVYIQSSIHAAEVQGYAVALHLLDYFANNPPKGDVTIVPLANPYGLNCKLGEHTFGRFDPVTGDNWNRHYVDLSKLVVPFLQTNPGVTFKQLIPGFKQALQTNLMQQTQKPMSYHKKLALALQIQASTADIVLDLHCDTISVPHVYSPTYAMQSVGALGIPFVIEIPHIFSGSLDEAIFSPWVALTEQYYRLHPNTTVIPPIEAFTLELGNQEYINQQHASKQAEGILHYLYSKGVVNTVTKQQNTSLITCKLDDFISLYSPVGGLIIDHATLGIPVKAKETCLCLSMPSSFKHTSQGHDLLTKTSKHIMFEHDSIPITKTATAVVHEGMVLMKLMRNYQQIIW